MKRFLWLDLTETIHLVLTFVAIGAMIAVAL